MVRAVVSARQASLERSGSAPAPCPQAEPRPDAEERRRETQRNAGGTCAGGACPGHVCKVARGGGGGAGTCERQAPDVRVSCVGLKGLRVCRVHSREAHAGVDFWLPSSEGISSELPGLFSLLSMKSSPAAESNLRPTVGQVRGSGRSVQHASNTDEGPNHRVDLVCCDSFAHMR